MNVLIKEQLTIWHVIGLDERITTNKMVSVPFSDTNKDS